MKDNIYQKIESNPKFKQLVRERGRFAWVLSAVMMGLYLTFIFLVAFAPKLLGTPLDANTSITWGIPVGIGLIVSAFILTGIYVYRANGEFDRLNQEILDEVSK